MCGITGIFAFNEAGRFHSINLARATDLLSSRGPDAQGTFIHERIGLGHRRLSIIDLSNQGAQPMSDESGRYTIVFNGEIYNYLNLRKELQSAGVEFFSDSDTEVLLKSYIHYGEKCLDQLNGFFAFAIFDIETDILFLARDRYGIKPLYYYHDEDKFLFASEITSIIAYGIPKKLNKAALRIYFELNYTPAPLTMLEGVKALLPGHCLKIQKKSVEKRQYYRLPFDAHSLLTNSYQSQQQQLKDLLHESVKSRLVSDVPLGTFLSGGIDSSIISGIAAQYKPGLQTFSIGYADEPYFDETDYANLAAEKFKTDHHVFKLTNADLYADIFKILDHQDQPFADSSAIPTYILSKKTRQYVTVALSGDGADEMLSGYNKHAAFLRSMQTSAFNQFIKSTGFIWQNMPQSRNNPIANKIRQLAKFSEGLNLSLAGRYWDWASIGRKNYVQKLLVQPLFCDDEWYQKIKGAYLKDIHPDSDINQLLLTDMQLVLPNDMLKKVDLMSMAHGLEIRVPFLDHRLVEFVFRLPQQSKINRQMRKRILQDTFKDLLPPELYQRSKKGFEVPLLKWFRGELRPLIENDLLQKEFIENQKIFNWPFVHHLLKKLRSGNPGDATAQVWALIAFQWWYKRVMM